MMYTVSCMVAMDYDIEADDPEDAKWQAIGAFLSDVGDCLDVNAEVCVASED